MVKFKGFSSIWQILTVIVFTLLCSLAMAQDKQVMEIKITGNNNITTEAIMSVITLKVGSPFSEQTLQESQRAIENMGYFERVIIGTENMETGLRVVFNLVENPVVNEIKISGNTIFPTDKIMELIRTTAGTVLNVKTLMDIDIPAIEKIYDDAGYIAYITEEVGIDPNTGVLSLPILEVRIEDIKITGNKKTKTYVIMREMQMKKGDVFNRNILFSDIRRIYDLELFDRENAEPYKLAPGTDLSKIIITLPVKEKKTGEISIGIGYGSKQKLVGQAKITEGNFRGTGQSVNAMWEQSGERGASYELGYYEPWLDKKHTSMNVSLYNKLIYRFANDVLNANGKSDSYDERRKGGSATLTRPFNYSSKGAFTFRTESINSKLQSSKVLSSNGTITSGTGRYTKTTRDSEIEPTSGMFTSCAIEVGNASFNEPGIINGLDGNKIFSKYSTDIRMYFSKRPKVNKEKDNIMPKNRKVIALRFMGGSLSGNVPFFEQYFLGGAESLRGYEEDRFWGKNMLLGSAEFRIPMGTSLIGVLFADYGDAWGARSIHRNPNDPNLADDPFKKILEEMPQHDGFSPSLGYGLGIRVATPIGPLRLDYGFGDEGSRAHFSIGHVF